MVRSSLKRMAMKFCLKRDSKINTLTMSVSTCIQQEFIPNCSHMKFRQRQGLVAFTGFLKICKSKVTLG